jgi:predicted PurR-regulated permease PerM
VTAAPRAGRVTREAAGRREAGEPSDEHSDEPGDEHRVRAWIRSPFKFGFFAAAGALVAYWLGSLLLSVGNLIILVVVALFLAAGLNPLVELLGRRGLKRSWSVLVVTGMVLAALVLFLVALVPVIAEQVSSIVDNAPGWFDELRRNRTVQRLDERYDVISRASDFVQSGSFGQQVAGGAVGFGVAVLSTLANAFIVIVLTLYFLATLPKVKEAGYRLAPASRRDRVRTLGDRIVRSIGGYVSGAFLVAVCAGISTLVFLFVVGLGEYAIALAAVVALLDVIPMIGATLGAVVVIAIGFATDPKIGLACLIFYVLYQQFENYVIYPRVMAKSVDIPGSVIVVAALVGAGLLGVLGALLAIPTAAAILLIVREVVVPRLDVH